MFQPSWREIADFIQALNIEQAIELHYLECYTDKRILGENTAIHYAMPTLDSRYKRMMERKVAFHRHLRVNCLTRLVKNKEVGAANQNKEINVNTNNIQQENPQ